MPTQERFPKEYYDLEGFILRLKEIFPDNYRVNWAVEHELPNYDSTGKIKKYIDHLRKCIQDKRYTEINEPLQGYMKEYEYNLFYLIKERYEDLKRYIPSIAKPLLCCGHLSYDYLTGDMPIELYLAAINYYPEVIKYVENSSEELIAHSIYVNPYSFIYLEGMSPKLVKILYESCLYHDMTDDLQDGLLVFWEPTASEMIDVFKQYPDIAEYFAINDERMTKAILEVPEIIPYLGCDSYFFRECLFNAIKEKPELTAYIDWDLSDDEYDLLTDEAKRYLKE